jgi:hypothetical protein
LCPQGAEEQQFLESASSAGSQEVLQLLNRVDPLPRQAAPALGRQPEAAGGAKGFRFTMFGKEGGGGKAAGAEAQVRLPPLAPPKIKSTSAANAGSSSAQKAPRAGDLKRHVAQGLAQSVRSVLV